MGISRMRERTMLGTLGSVTTFMLLVACFLITGCSSPRYATPFSSPTVVTLTPVITSTPTGPELDATKMAPLTPEFQTVVAAATQYAIATPIPPTFEPLPTTVPLPPPELGIHSCGGANRSFDSTACWTGQNGNEYISANSGTLPSDPQQGILRIITSTLDRQINGDWHWHTLPVRENGLYIANVTQPRIMLFVLRDAVPNSTFAFNISTQAWEEPGQCQLYPVALHASTFAGAQGRFDVRGATYGAASGNFGWLDWTGPAVSDTLAVSLTPPGDSDTYINPDNQQDHIVSEGDWVAGRPEVLNDQAVENAMSSMVDGNYRYVFPLWDQVTGEGDSLRYRISGFAWAGLDDFSVAQPNTITMRYWGQASCPDNP